MRGQPSLIPRMSRKWLGKPLMYGIGTLLVMPLRTLHGVGRMFGAARYLCNMTSVSSSLQIELVSALKPSRIYSRLSAVDHPASVDC
jgi:hydroxyacylglutathione hydrolase